MRKLFTGDRVFFSTLLTIAAPIAIQQMIVASINFVDVLMIGQLGEVSVAAVGLANQIFFLYMLALFGISSGSAIFTAQFWGKRDVQSIRKVMGLSLTLSLLMGSVFMMAALVFPRQVLGIYTEDQAVIDLGSSYLRIVGVSYLATAITFSFSAILRSTENTRLPMMVSVTALTLNAVSSYVLIFGHLGLPALGVRGAALATCAARILEAGALVYLSYRLKTAAAAKIRELFAFNFEFFKRYIKTSMPVVVNEVTWSLGVTTYNVVYARIGTESIAAVNIATTIENLALVGFMALANASAIMIGNRIGAGEERKAYEYGRTFIVLSIAGAVGMGAILFAVSPWILTFYKVAEQVAVNARYILMVLSFAMWAKVTNMILFVGVLRSGGDTRFAFLIDTGSIWLIGVPLAFTGAFLLHLPVYWVVVMIMADELFKFVTVMFRFRSGKWINNLTVHHPAAA